MATGTKRCTCPDHDGPNPLPLSEFYSDKAQADRLSPRCRECDKAKARRWAQANPEYVRENNRRLAPAKSRSRARANAASLDGAHHHRQPWTLPQLAIAARDDLTIRQAAAMTGRTMHAVRTVRRNLRSGRHTEVMEDTWT